MSNSRLVVAGILAIHALLLVGAAFVHSPTLHELPHVPAGLSHWRSGMFDLYRVNPPLPRMLATFPLLFTKAEVDWSGHSVGPLARNEMAAGLAFARTNGTHAIKWVILARMACLPFSVAGGAICAAWSTEMWGKGAGIPTALLWSFSPFVLGHGSLVMPDIPAAACGVASGYCMARWHKDPSWSASILCGIVLGVALLCKLTLLVLVLVWLVLCVARASATQSLRRRIPAMATGLLVAIGVINCGYGFRGSFSSLDSYVFQSRLLTNAQEAVTRNRIFGTTSERVWVPLPRDYVIGIDAQKHDFERGMRSYINGRWRQQGWWYYYLYGLSLKMPLGSCLVVAVGAVQCVVDLCRGRSIGDGLSVVLPGLTILGAVSSQTGLSMHLRYALPALPFFFVLAGKAVQPAAASRRMSFMVGLAVAWSIASSLWCYPHSIAYFNEIIGGPRRGHLHFLESNCAWGQDLLFLRRWMKDKHDDPVRIAALGMVHPSILGVEIELPPAWRYPARKEQIESIPHGWYVIDVNYLHGTEWPAAGASGHWHRFSLHGANLRYFMQCKPAAMIGYSYVVYQIPAGQRPISKTMLKPP